LGAEFEEFAEFAEFVPGMPGRVTAPAAGGTAVAVAVVAGVVGWLDGWLTSGLSWDAARVQECEVRATPRFEQHLQHLQRI
jgi:hypothetical protein